jgi:hypothetical protein
MAMRLVLAVLSITAIAWSQQAYPERVIANRGFLPGASYDISSFDSVNVTNGNLVLTVPVASLPAGRAGLSASVSLVYNSAIYDIQTELDSEFRQRSRPTGVGDKTDLDIHAKSQ